MGHRFMSNLEIQSSSSEGLWPEESNDDSVCPWHIAFSARHFTEEIEGTPLYVEKYCKEKIKTLTVALVICLNIDIDPPDVQKIPPFCRVEAWFDPTDANSLRALETIGKNLQIQYERWHSRARYKQCLDPTLDDVKKLCISLRRNAKEDRILFHYNGHGVPRPTENGEIWVFNTKFTKYIPLSLYDLQRWLGAPSVYVFDCQNAGRVIRMYENFCHRRLTEQHMTTTAPVTHRSQQMDSDATNDGPTAGVEHGPVQATTGPIPNFNGESSKLPGHPGLGQNHVTAPLVTMENTIMLAACRENEDLPQNPELPADLFTACLTTPIRMALRWHWLRHQERFPGYLDEALLDRIPGSHSNRMSLLGEVNWIFTAVTDTIAWCSFPTDIFQKLFRQDLLVASLFRNFLLAERIMKMYGCNPVSAPALLPTFRHPMWSAWDHALDRVVHYLPRMLKLIEGSPYSERKLPIISPGNGFYPLNTHSRSVVNTSGGLDANTNSTTAAVAAAAAAAAAAVPLSHRSGNQTIVVPNGINANRMSQQVEHRPGPPERITGLHGNGSQYSSAAAVVQQPKNVSRVVAPSTHSKLVGADPIQTNVKDPPQIRPPGLPRIPARPAAPLLDRTCHLGVGGKAPPGFRAPSQLNPESVVRRTDENAATRRMIQPNSLSRSSAQHCADPNFAPQSQSKEVTRESCCVEVAEISDSSIPPTISAPPIADTETSNLPVDAATNKTQSVSKPREEGDKPTNKVTFSEDVDSDEDADDEAEEDEEDSDEVDDDDVEIDESDVDDEDESASGKREVEALEKTTRTASSLEKLVQDHGVCTNITDQPNANKSTQETAFQTKPKLRRAIGSCPTLATLTAFKSDNRNKTVIIKQDPSTFGTKSGNRTASKHSAVIGKSDHSNQEGGGVSAATEVTPIKIIEPIVPMKQPSELTEEAQSSKPVTNKAPLRRQQHGVEHLYTLQGQASSPVSVAPIPTIPQAPSTDRPLCPPRPQPKCEQPQVRPIQQQVNGAVAPVSAGPEHMTFNVAPQPTLITTPTTAPPSLIQSQPAIPQTNQSAASAGPVVAPVSSGSVIGGSGPASFFTSQMTAFKVWLQTADEKQPPATQLPILLQILLSQSHRIRAMQLLSEFLDLGPWAVSHCLTVGILPYIVRLFHSPVAEVKPLLVFIWGKIIATAQTEFGRNDSVRDFGYKYFITCLSDTENLTPLTRTITAFALAKMLEKEPNGESDAFFQDMYLKQNFIPLVLSQLDENPPTIDVEIYIRFRLWLIFSLAKVWRNNDEARWFGVRYNVPEVLFTYLNDISPEVRAATVYALGTLIANQTSDASKQDHADQVSHQVGAHLVRLAYLDASWLVRCELVVAFAGFARQFEVQLCAMALCYVQEMHNLPPSATATAAQQTGLSVRPSRHSITGHTNIYAQFWHAIVRLSQDAHPEVGRMGRVVLHYILSKVTELPCVTDSSLPADSVLIGPVSRSNPDRPVARSRSPTPTGSLQTSSAVPSAISTVIVDTLTPSTEACSNTGSEVKTDANKQTTSSPDAAIVRMRDTKTNSSARSVEATLPNACRLTTTTGQPLSTSVARKSTFLLHSAHFPSRRHHMVDQLLRGPVGNPSVHTQSSLRTGASAASANSPVPATMISAPTDRHPLDEIKTQLFAWSCRWFAQPLLSKFGDSPDPNAHLVQSDTSDSIVTPRRCSHPNPDLAALGAVSVDPDAVAYSDRLIRWQQQREVQRNGRLRWMEVVGSRDRYGTNVRSATIDVNTPATVSTKSNLEPGYLVNLNSRHGLHEPSLIRFHPYQPHLVVSDQSGLTVCSTDGLEVLGHLNTSQDASSLTQLVGSVTGLSGTIGQVTDIEFLNSFEERSLLLTAHDDGRLRVWRNYIRDLGQDSEIVTAWSGLNDLLPSTHLAGLVLHWCQATTQLAVGGDARAIRLWDCERESRLRDIPTGADACVTVLARSPDLRLLAVGFGDGGIKAFDLRMASGSSSSRSHTDNHIFAAQCDSGWVHDVKFSPLNRLYATGSTGGVVSWQLGMGGNEPTTGMVRAPTHRGKPLSASSTAKVSTDQVRFRRLSVPQRLSLPNNTPVHCAAFKVDLPISTAHLLAAGIGGTTCEVRLHRIHDGSVHSVHKSSSTPLSIAVHPNKPLIAFGAKDKSITLLRVEARRTSRI